MRAKNFVFRQVDGETALPIQITTPINPGRVIRFVASDDTLDRYDEVILAEGWVLDNYTRNPVVMQFHCQQLWPIGKAVAIGVVGNELMIDCEFDPADIDTEADKVFKKIKHGTISAGSVGFLPWSYEDFGGADNAELFAKYPGAKRIYTSCELLEWTICPVPANPAALAAALQSNVNDRFIEGAPTKPTAVASSPTKVDEKIDDLISKWR